MTLKLFILGALFLALGAFGVGYFMGQGTVTGNVVAETSGKAYSWTTAICNDNQQCIDVLVVCAGKTVVSVTPVSNLTQFSEEWEDPRNETVILCA